jgi:hypothetical protein
MEQINIHMHDIAQKQIFFKKLPELDPDQDLVVKFPDPDPAKRSGSATLTAGPGNTGLGGITPATKRILFQ